MAFFRSTRKSDQEPAGQGPAAQNPPTAPNPQTSAGGQADESEARTGWWQRLRHGLEKTQRLLNTDVRDLFKREGADGRLVDEEFLKDLFSRLVKTDMGAGPAEEIVERVRVDFRGRVVRLEDVLTIVQDRFRELLAQPVEPIHFAAAGPTVVMVVGVNGSGKTTSIAKLGHLFRQQGHSVVMGAGDTFRAGAVRQLAVWAQRIGAEFVEGPERSDPASVAHRTVAKALELNAGVCIIDTAGRLQTQTSLMQELSKIRRVVTKLIPDAPHEVLLVLDATAGQNGISQAKGFSEAAGCTGIVLAKLDGTAKGGVVVPIRRQFNIPVKFIGVGEGVEDLALFKSDEFVAALFSDSSQPPPAA
ncbi:MAG: signal recognition particle-docking protein FtsY [Pirellulaceae bacterium]